MPRGSCPNGHGAASMGTGPASGASSAVATSVFSTAVRSGLVDARQGLGVGSGALGFTLLVKNYPLMWYLGRDQPPEESMQHDAVSFPPQLIARWRGITREQFFAAFAGVSQAGRVRWGKWLAEQHICDSAAKNRENRQIVAI